MSIEQNQDRARQAFARLRDKHAQKQQQAPQQTRDRPPAPALRPGQPLRGAGDAEAHRAIAADRNAALRERLQQQRQDAQKRNPTQDFGKSR